MTTEQKKTQNYLTLNLSKEHTHIKWLAMAMKKYITLEEAQATTRPTDSAQFDLTKSNQPNTQPKLKKMTIKTT